MERVIATEFVMGKKYPGKFAIGEMLKARNAAVRYAGRHASASTATGLMSRHLKELKEFLEAALG